METLKFISSMTVPVIIIFIVLIGFIRGVKLFDVFLEGAKTGVSTVISVLPSLVGLLVAVGVFRASGALDILVSFIKPVTNMVGIPAEVLPLAILRPISGSASLAVVSDILKAHGPDSFVGYVASTMMGSTETIFYTIAVYFGAVGIKNIRYTLLAALVADVAGIIASVWICRIIFGG